MDLVAEMLLKHLRAEHASTVEATRVCPPLRYRFSRLPVLGKKSFAFNSDRLVNRFRDYPRLLKREREKFDLFHLVDHSYAQLVHELPAERTIVTCHDLDTFRSVLEPEREPRARWFVAMTGKILDGLRRAARVTCDSVATQEELLKYQIVPVERTVVIPNGVHPSCSPDGDAAADREAARLLGDESDAVIDLLHVGSTVARKRIDVLLQVFAEVREEFPGARLLRAGGEFTAQQMKLVERLGLSQSILVLPQLSRPVLAAVYRRAALVLQPSEREGFGLPVVEALACGAPVVASDLDVLREVGGEAAVYCPVALVGAWSEAVRALLHERRDDSQRWEARRRAGLAQAARFTWSEYADKMVALYRDLWYS
jgi:glycosyltransferase involved in cell wall biosynthesis